ncbi:chromosome segregation protein SMC [bacterium D16-54]|nr:chromosome segregation protein SMC [bacterium D16-54]RKJ16118.1 chromosome segregation protein SMC [bacterium D16-56]
MTDPSFEALSRICLNNWHYIRHRTLCFHEGVNFFTGHSGSGKSTVIDAMQIVLYANTDGRGFFNKAAADDSDRSLVEYLRGMVNIGEDNRFSYLRNQNFSSTIVLELRRTDTGECQCVGVAFDVETANNQVSRMFFWHKGELPKHEYRVSDKAREGDKGSGRAMSVEEVKRWLLENFSREDCYFGSHNERFRRQLYDIYLGGLDSEKFPLLFKRAIPFRMNLKLEDFVREYICVEQDIHIEDMQVSVMEYGRLRQKIEDTCQEIGQLKEICEKHRQVESLQERLGAFGYYMDKLDILKGRLEIQESQEKIYLSAENAGKIRADIEKHQEMLQEMTGEADELLKKISMTGYEQMEEQLASLNDLTERLSGSKARWEQTAGRLRAWEDQDTVSNRTLWDIQAFVRGNITEEELIRLKRDLEELRKEAVRQQQSAQGELRELKKRLEQAKEELRQLKTGGKAYPAELEQARTLLQTRLYRETGKSVSVEILADLLDIRNEEWRNAAEGYLGYQKLSLMVEPKYARECLKIYQELDQKKFYRISVVDTERVASEPYPVAEGALAEEVEAKKDYAQAYVNFLLGKVMKCENVEDLRRNRIGITRDCVSYHGYRLQHINPVLYTTSAYIGKASLRQRVRLLEQSVKDLEKAMGSWQTTVGEAKKLLEMEYLGQELSVYLEWKKDMDSYGKEAAKRDKLRAKLEELLSQDVERWKQERRQILDQCSEKRELLRQLERRGDDLDREEKRERARLVDFNEDLAGKEKAFQVYDQYEKELAEFLEEKSQKSRGGYDLLASELAGKRNQLQEKQQQERDRLVEMRTEYLKHYPNRNFSPTAQDNTQYQELFDHLNDDRLEEFRVRAAEQARTAVEHFKDDFMYKIRSAIKEAIQQKDELNRIISRLDFGKDRYQFYIGRNKGADGQYYDMFMDEALEINPSELDIGLDHQLNLFTVEHENHYGAMINELIRIFIPPENATAAELEEARRNMDKYADYRTYLSFDMQQIIQNEDEQIKIRLSKMIKKNSGGEGQNPLYVALLASFAQAYKIHVKPGLLKRPTIRLVVLDEAFSKMDGEKVASCIKLIRGLGFQALISATNDKIQNYLETVDKVFVFANPNKRAISIQEFEKKEFGKLREGMEG